MMPVGMAPPPAAGADEPAGAEPEAPDAPEPEGMTAELAPLAMDDIPDAMDEVRLFIALDADAMAPLAEDEPVAEPVSIDDSPVAEPVAGEAEASPAPGTAEEMAEAADSMTEATPEAALRLAPGGEGELTRTRPEPWRRRRGRGRRGWCGTFFLVL